MSNNYIPPKPSAIGIVSMGTLPLQQLVPYIDWTPFFLSWELRGKYPAIFEDAKFGKEAVKLFNDAHQILDRIIADNSLTAKAVCGFFPANSVNDDDIEIYTDDSRNMVRMTLHMLRQQSKRGQNLPNLCLADLIAPKDAGIPDYIGAFVVTAGIGTEQLCRQYEVKHDDFSSIMVKAIADRLAEAAANGCTSASAANYGDMLPMKSFPTKTALRKSIAAFALRPAIPPAPTTLKNSNCLRC